MDNDSSQRSPSNCVSCADETGATNVSGTTEAASTTGITAATNAAGVADTSGTPCTSGATDTPGTKGAAGTTGMTSADGFACSQLHGLSVAGSVMIPNAGTAWQLIMQSGVLVPCTVGVSLDEVLRVGLELSEEQLAPVDALLLDGMPVDEPEKTIVPDKARLALASALPGIAGLAMKKGSAVRGLRSGITHSTDELPHPRPGWICLSLYSLTLPQLAGHFLERGVFVETAQLLRYARLAPDDLCVLNGKTMQTSSLANLPGNLFGNLSSSLPSALTSDQTSGLPPDLHGNSPGNCQPGFMPEGTSQSGSPVIFRLCVKLCLS
ncbi:hypothetical protein LJC48_07710 [Desulfovibrio sp. OttesenSCG-928-C06]|nr:hypothetical protein [Desulfovibrio sp. OttesenSCG-928-C06]